MTPARAGPRTTLTIRQHLGPLRLRGLNKPSTGLTQLNKRTATALTIEELLPGVKAGVSEVSRVQAVQLAEVVDQGAHQHTLLHTAVLDLDALQVGQLLEDGLLVYETPGSGACKTYSTHYRTIPGREDFMWNAEPKRRKHRISTDRVGKRPTSGAPHLTPAPPLHVPHRPLHRRRRRCSARCA